MTRKRANGRGTIYFDRTRNRYEVRVVIDGQRRKATGRTQDEAWARADALVVAAAAGPGVSAAAIADPGGYTVGAFLDDWIVNVLPLTPMQPHTRANYANIVRLYIAPSIGAVPLERLAPGHVRAMLGNLRTAGKSTNTQRLARSVLRRALRTAEIDGLVTRNVAALVDGVQQDHREGRSLTPDEARTLLAAADDSPIGPLVTVMLALGTRKGETLGLTWPDVELDGPSPSLRIRRALKKDGAGGLILAEPKTAGSRRPLDLPSVVVDALRRQRASQAAERLAFGSGWGRRWPALVFTNTIGGPLDPDRVNRDVQALTASAGLGRWTPHELRHTAASLQLAAGTPLKVVSELLGHANIRVTADVYAHVLPAQRAEAAATMEALLRGG